MHHSFVASSRATLRSGGVADVVEIAPEILPGLGRKYWDFRPYAGRASRDLWPWLRG